MEAYSQPQRPFGLNNDVLVREYANLVHFGDTNDVHGSVSHYQLYSEDSSHVYPAINASGDAQLHLGDKHYHIEFQGDKLEEKANVLGVDTNEINAVATLAWKLYKSCRAAPESFENIQHDLAALSAVIEDCEEVFANLIQQPKRAQRLHIILLECKDILSQLNAIVTKYEDLDTQQKCTWERMRWCSTELGDIKVRINTYMGMLAAFLSTSQIRIEQKLEQFMKELLGGCHDGSVVSGQTVDSLDKDARIQWRIVRKELTRHGVTLDLFEANKEFIYNWIERAVKEAIANNEIPIDSRNEIRRHEPKKSSQNVEIPIESPNQRQTQGPKESNQHDVLARQYGAGLAAFPDLKRIEKNTSPRYRSAEWYKLGEDPVAASVADHANSLINQADPLGAKPWTDVYSSRASSKINFSFSNAFQTSFGPPKPQDKYHIRQEHAHQMKTRLLSLANSVLKPGKASAAAKDLDVSVDPYVPWGYQ